MINIRVLRKRTLRAIHLAVVIVTDLSLSITTHIDLVLWRSYEGFSLADVSLETRG
jgi:hypothetical protein